MPINNKNFKEYTLDSNQKKIIKNLDFLKDFGFYLAGGTALALQIGHRRSYDLDFYTREDFNGKELAKIIQSRFGRDVQKPKSALNTLWIKVKNVEISFFKYSYKLIRPTINYQSVTIASKDDIAAMKIEAIIGRGVKRDFVDVYFLLKEFGLKKVIEFARAKYGDLFNEQNCLYALQYFKDAEAKQKDRKRIYIYSNISWNDVKSYLKSQVISYQKLIIKELRK